MTITENPPAEAVCARAHCGNPLPAPSRSGGRPAKYCGTACRKTDNRAATAARSARASMPGLRERLDEALTTAEAAVRRVHFSALSPQETLVDEPAHPGDVSYAVARAIENLKYAAREYKDAWTTAGTHPAGAEQDQDEEE